MRRVLVALSAVLVVWTTVEAGVQPSPAFEVAIIKPSGPDSPAMSLQPPPD